MTGVVCSFDEPRVRSGTGSSLVRHLAMKQQRCSCFWRVPFPFTLFSSLDQNSRSQRRISGELCAWELGSEQLGACARGQGTPDRFFVGRDASYIGRSGVVHNGVTQFAQRQFLGKPEGCVWLRTPRSMIASTSGVARRQYNPEVSALARSWKATRVPCRRVLLGDF
jgi:hypothetical protein